MTPIRTPNELRRAAELITVPVEIRQYFTECIECGLQHYCPRCGKSLSSLLLCFADGTRFTHTEIVEAERIAAYEQGEAVERSEPCSNCGTLRLIDEQGEVEKCPTCGDDA